VTLSRFGGVYAALHAGHSVADMWAQTGRQAEVKSDPGWDGRIACAAHVATLTATQGVFLSLACWTTGERLPWRLVAAGLAVNAVSHYVADRRTPLRYLAGRLAGIGKADFYASGDGLASGAHALDQAWHVGWCAISAAIIAGRVGA
jgi:hypothetical protein